MKHLHFIPLFGLLSLFGECAEGALLVKMDEPKHSGDKVVMKLTLQNTFKEKIESARATVFLFDDHRKMVGQQTAWVIGGTKEKPPLAADATTTYSFVVPGGKPLTKTKLAFSRINLEGGKTADPHVDFELMK